MTAKRALSLLLDLAPRARRPRLSEQTATGLGATSRSPVVLAVQRLLVRPGLRGVGQRAYELAARAVLAALLLGHRDAAGYARGSLASGEVVPGISDVDLAVVVAADVERVHRRWRRLERAVPPARLLVDRPRMYADAELRAAAGATALTYDGAAYADDDRSRELVRMLERPGLDGQTAGWRLLRGPERRPPETARDAQGQRLAAWLELVYWWRWAFAAASSPPGPRMPAQCVKLVAEPGRIWLLLAHDERPATRAGVLDALLRRLPEEEHAIRAAIALQRTLADDPAASLADVLPVLLRMSERIAALLGHAAVQAGGTDVALDGDGGSTPVVALCDWRALVCPPAPAETLVPFAGDPLDPAALGAAARGHDGPAHPAAWTGDLLLLPATSVRRTRMRSVQCPVTDPVSFVLRVGARIARFPNLAGWSVQDAARRAVLEHRARLDAGGGDAATLLTAARAALLDQSLRDGAPRVQLTVEAVARALPGDAATEVVDRLDDPPAAALRALDRQVRALAAFR